MNRKDYISPEFSIFSVNLNDVLAISNPRVPTEEVPSSGVDEGGDDLQF